MKALYNGKIYSNEIFEEALLIDGKIIRAIGSSDNILAMISDNDEKIDLQGRLVLPGFIDSHAHGPLSCGMTIGNVDMSGGTTQNEYLAIIKQYVSENPDREIYSGSGWINPSFPGQCPSKESLDEICAEKPMVFISGDGHSVWCNSKAMEMAGVTADTPDPEGGLIEKNPDGSLKGCLRDQARFAALALIPETSIEDYKKVIWDYQTMMIEYGCTAVFDAMVDVGSNLHKAYREMAEEGTLRIKVGMSYSSDPENPMDLLPQYTDIRKGNVDKLYEGQFVKIFVDGVVEGGTAYLKEEYCNKPGHYGEPLWQQDVLNEFCAAVDKAGYDLHYHVIGDAAVDQMLCSIEYINKVNGKKARNVVAAHMQVVDPADYTRLKDLDIRISSDPYWFVKAPGYYEDIELPCLGERALKEYPMKAYFDLGLIVSGASDYMVTPVPYPPMGIQTAMLRTMPGQDHTAKENVLWEEEKITLEQGIQVFTENGAITMGIDDVTGKLEPGMMADIVIMDDDLFEIAPENYADSKVYMTISEGEIVYRF